MTKKPLPKESDVFDEFDDDVDPDAEALSHEAPAPTPEMIAELQEKVDSLDDQLKRAHAEMENTRRIAKRRVEEAHRFGNQKFADSLLPVIDTLERSLEVEVDDDGVGQQIYKGIEMTLELFLTTLGKFEIEVINPVGEAFNPDFHEAVQTVEDPEVDSGNILKVLQKGYTLSGRLMRPAMVVIAS